MPLIRKNRFYLDGIDVINTSYGEVNSLKLYKKDNFDKKFQKLLMECKSLDIINKYSVNKEKRTIMAEAIFKIIGITMTRETRKLANQICKKYPKLQYGEGPKPSIKLKRISYSEDFKFENAVSVNLFIKNKLYRIGWLSSREEEFLEDTLIVPNAIITELLISDELNSEKDRVIQSYELCGFGSFEKQGKRLYWGKIKFKLNLDNIED